MSAKERASANKPATAWKEKASLTPKYIPAQVKKSPVPKGLIVKNMTICNVYDLKFHMYKKYCKFFSLFTTSL